MVSLINFTEYNNNPDVITASASSEYNRKVGKP